MFIIPQVGQVIRRAALLTQVLSTVLVFVVLITFTVISWQNAEQTLSAQKDQVVNEQSDIIRDAVEQRMQTNGVLLRAGAGFFDGSEAVTRDEWRRFFVQFDVTNQFLGVSSVGYAPIVRSADLPAFEASMRGDLPDYAVTPAGSRELYTPIMYAEGFRGGQPRFGFDMYSDPARRVAMDAARDTGVVTMTDSVELVDTGRSGVLLFIPVYNRGASLVAAADRQNAVRGYVFASLRTNELFGNIGPTEDRDMGFTVGEMIGDNVRQIYSSFDPESDDGATLRQVRTTDLDLYGQRWQIELFADETIVSATENQRPSTILAGGAAISLIASLAVFLLIQYRTRSFALAEEHRLQNAKDELLSLASHQLRTPATGVKQYVGMVLDGFGGSVPKEQVALLEQAYKSNERQLQIINEFLYVAKLGSGSLTTTVHEFDLAAVVRDVIDEMSNEIKDKNHRLTTKLPQKCIVNADEHSVRMIVENLLSNAVKYTHPGGKIRVMLRRTPFEVLLTVSDTGIGISRRDLPLLFRQFSRIPNELSGEVSGSGIGLYLAQQLALRNNGRITVASEPAEGSSFTLHLPTKSVKKLTKISRK